MTQTVRAIKARSAQVAARAHSPTLPVNPSSLPVNPSSLPVNPSSLPFASAWAKPAMGPTVAPVNVDMLAAQVVRQIDRRITAWRERTGRP